MNYNVLKSLLNAPNLNLKNIQEEINKLNKLKVLSNYDYLNDLLYPEKRKSVKIPSNIPIPSCSFTLSEQFQVQANNMGFLMLRFSPFLLFTDNIYGSRFTLKVNTTTYYCYANYLTSLSYFRRNNWQGEPIEGVNINSNIQSLKGFQAIPPVYSKYRLVSGSLSLRYIGELVATQGTIGGGILYEDQNYLRGRYFRYTNPNKPFNPTDYANQYGINDYVGPMDNINVIRDATYHQENNLLDGIRLLYFPIDSSYKDFYDIISFNDIKFIPKSGTTAIKAIIPLKKTKTGFTWYVYCANAPSAATMLVSINLNFEAIPSSEYLDYIPVTADIYNMTYAKEKEIIEKVQEVAIQKI